eukprot:scaffold95832_cov63-Phaeocystis_antarctica.AAC.3
MAPHCLPWRVWLNVQQRSRALSKSSANLPSTHLRKTPQLAPRAAPAGRAPGGLCEGDGRHLRARVRLGCARRPSIARARGGVSVGGPLLVPRRVAPAALLHGNSLARTASCDPDATPLLAR